MYTPLSNVADDMSWRDLHLWQRSGGPSIPKASSKILDLPLVKYLGVHFPGRVPVHHALFRSERTSGYEVAIVSHPRTLHVEYRGRL